MIVVDTTDLAFSRHPHEMLREARERSPIAFDAFGTPMLLRYADVDAALKDPRFVNDYDVLITRHGITSGPLYDWWKLAMLNTNPPVHTRLRSLASRAFTPRATNGTRERMRALTIEHLQEFEGRDSIDLIDDVTESLPLTIVCDMIGVPRDDHGAFHQWVADIGLMFSDSIPDENRARAEHAMFALGDYVVAMIEHKRRNPDESLMSMLIAAEEGGDRLSYDELVALVVNLMLGALDTSRSALSIGLWLLWTRGLRAVTPALIEEILRYEPPSGELRRTAGEDFDLCGVPVAAGTSVALSVMAANRDASAYDEADQFIAERYETGIAAKATTKPHLTFGRGSHFCLGQAIARVEMHEVLDVIFTRYPDLEVLTDSPQWVPFLRVRRFEKLPVRLGDPS
ncbi:MAG: cytochrome P450 [Acidimicrobiales bacterium]